MVEYLNMLIKSIYNRDVLSTAFVLTCLIYLLVPLIFRYYNPFSRKIIFLNLIQWPPFVDFNYPEALGLEAAKNYYLEPEPGIKLGVWHILPKDLASNFDNSTDSLKLLKSGYPVVFYLHGNAGTRAGWHRIMLYKIFSSLNFHVICFDYRGFGDSMGIPSEENVLSDSYFVFKYIQQYTSNVILWGHSLGSGVTTKLARHLSENGQKPLAVVLEAPFTNIEDAASSHPFSKIYRYFPFFAGCFLEPLRRNNLFFQSDKNIKYVNSPLLILHAKDDHVVPYDLGYKLYQIAKEHTRDTDIPIEFQSFEPEFKYGHKHIHTAPDLPDIIKAFMDKYVKPQIEGNQTYGEIVP